MYYIVYISTAAKWLDETELKELLKVSRINNARDHITSLLLYGNGTFIQALEGEHSQLQTTFARICRDVRHNGISSIAEGELIDRNFPHFSMGFKSVDPTSLSGFEGFFDPKIKELPAAQKGHLAVNLLKAFIRSKKISS